MLSKKIAFLFPLCKQLLCRVSQALESGVIEFIDENGGGLGVRLSKRQRVKPAK
jgi:hypothetical protein